MYVLLNKKKARREVEARERAICACEAKLRSLKLGVRFLKTRAQIKEGVQMKYYLSLSEQDSKLLNYIRSKIASASPI